MELHFRQCRLQSLTEYCQGAHGSDGTHHIVRLAAVFPLVGYGDTLQAQASIFQHTDAV